MNATHTDACLNSEIIEWSKAGQQTNWVGSVKGCSDMTYIFNQNDTG